MIPIKRWICGDNVVADATIGMPHRKVYTWFMDILLDDGATFPIEEVSVSPSSRNMTKRDLFHDFILRLIHFWSGSTRLSRKTTYRIGITPHGFPKSNATKKELLLPKDVRSKDELYRKLVIATFNITEGRGLYGGRLH
jgi:hypothetical protein